MIWYLMIEYDIWYHNIWYMIWYNIYGMIRWYDIWYYTIWYMIWYDTICDMIWCYTIWYIIYDIWYDMIYDMLRYAILYGTKYMMWYDNILPSFTFFPLPISYIPFTAIHNVLFSIPHFLAYFLPFPIPFFLPSDSWEAVKHSTYKHKVCGSEWIQVAQDSGYWRTVLQRVIKCQIVQKWGGLRFSLSWASGSVRLKEDRRSISRSHPLYKPLNTTGTRSRIFKHICFRKTGDLELIKNGCLYTRYHGNHQAHLSTKLCGKAEPTDI
jgi:hypothetical protein